MISAERIRELITQGEVRNTNVEFKTCSNGVGRSVFETICAFLNRNGGEVLLGVEDDGRIVGVNESQIDIQNTPNFLPYFGKVKMLVGVTKQKKNAKKIQYSITAIEPVK